MAFVGTFFVGICDYLCDAERVGVEWCLGDKAVGEGDAEEAGYACGDAKKEDVPVKASGLSEGEFRALSDEGGHYSWSES